MQRLVIKSWLLLFYFACVLRLFDFKRLHRVVREQNVQLGAQPDDTCDRVCHALDLACVFYFKRVLCLQRSAVTTVLLRRHGWKAEMVLGAQLLPFLSHAWVEVDGRIVNDKPYISELFRVLERC
jgi:hypothetical protein